MPRRKNYSFRVTVRTKHGKAYLRYRDPITGDEQIRVATKTTPSEIEREAGAWENELREGIDRKRLEEQKAKQEAIEAASRPVITSWKDFRERFFTEHLSSLAAHSVKAFTSAFVQFEKYCENQPKSINEIASTHISKFAAAYRASGVAETTIASRLTHLRAAFQWAKTIGKIIAEVPEFPRTKRAKKGQRRRPAKGRAITPDEFTKILESVEKVSTSELDGVAVKLRKRFLEALYWGGLRLDECLNLSRDSSSGKIWVDLHRFSHPMLIIPADAEKGGKDRIYPAAPEFAAILEEECGDPNITGPVFPLVVRRSDQNKNRQQIGMVAASKMIIAICRKAGVYTHHRGQGAKREQQPAGAQAFRRAFGERWVRRKIMPQVLQQMMRHEDIETTMRYYVALESETLATDIYAAYDADMSPDMSPETNKESESTDQGE